MKKISVIVPVYNAEKYLHFCVDSIINQTYKNIELILVDDGSSDSSPKLCDDYGAKYDFIKVFHKENAGQSSARNLGIKNATGEYISFVDNDDLIHPQYYEIISKIIEETKSQIVYCSKKLVGTREEIIIEPIENYDYKIISTSDILLHDLVNCKEAMFLNAFHTKVVSTELLKKHYFTEELRDEEDTVLSTHLCFDLDKVIKTDACLYFNIREKTSITRRVENLYKNWVYLLKSREMIIDKIKTENYEYTDTVINNMFIKVVRELRPIFYSDIDNFLKCKEMILSYFKPEMINSFYGKQVYKNLKNNNYKFLFFILRGFIYNFYFKRI